jgi:SAM-dependent methyltransferase
MDTALLKNTDGYAFFSCRHCESIFIDPVYMAKIDRGLNIVKYNDEYWKRELISAKDRAYSSSLARLAEAIYYCKIPVRHFLDIGTGPGFLLDAVSGLLPDHAEVFYGVELFPPHPALRTRSGNYFIGELRSFPLKVDCGMCIEVIEHLTPAMLDNLLAQLASVSNPGALFIFNTGMPDYVLHEDIDYLDPVKRGHLVSYSIEAIRIIGGRNQFTTHRIGGKTWAFALEFTSPQQGPETEDIRDRVWKALPENLALLSDSRMGAVLKVLGLETSRAYG